MEIGKSIQELEVGMKISMEHTFSQKEINGFASLTGDHNPFHVDIEFMKTTKYKKPIVHGLFSTSLWGTLLGMKLPGPGCLYVSQTTNFKRPVFVDDKVTAEVEVKSIDIEKNRVIFTTLLRNQENKIVAEGEAVVLPKR